MFTKNGIGTLTNIIIANPMRADLFPQSCATQKFIASNVGQAKKGATTINTLLIDSSL
jgi:hypothetical protein